MYLPKGSWYDFFTGEMIKGGEKTEVKAQYDQIPVFVKEGDDHTAGKAGTLRG